MIPLPPAISCFITIQNKHYLFSAGLPMVSSDWVHSIDVVVMSYVSLISGYCNSYCIDFSRCEIESTIIVASLCFVLLKTALTLVYSVLRIWVVVLHGVSTSLLWSLLYRQNGVTLFALLRVQPLFIKLLYFIVEDCVFQACIDLYNIQNIQGGGKKELFISHGARKCQIFQKVV